MATHSHHLSPDHIGARSERKVTQGKQQKSLFSWISLVDHVNHISATASSQEEVRTGEKQPHPTWLQLTIWMV